MTSEMTPVATNLNETGTDLSRTLQALAPFSRHGIPAFQSLGQTADVGTQALEVAEPTIALLGDFTDDARQPLAPTWRSCSRTCATRTASRT